MGYIRHHCIVVTGQEDEIVKLNKQAESLFEVVSPILPSVMNSYVSFFIPPDGSKEGWEESDLGDMRRRKFIQILTKSSARWVELQYGDDEGVTKIINKNRRE